MDSDFFLIGLQGELLHVVSEGRKKTEIRLNSLTVAILIQALYDLGGLDFLLQAL